MNDNEAGLTVMNLTESTLEHATLHVLSTASKLLTWGTSEFRMNRMARGQVATLVYSRCVIITDVPVAVRTEPPGPVHMYQWLLELNHQDQYTCTSALQN